MLNLNRSLEIFIKGMIVGGTMLVPGVSGGSMAIILGIYDRLIRAVGSLPGRLLRNLLFLGIFAAGGGIGMLLFSRPMLYLMDHYQRPALYFFVGAVLGGVPAIGKKAGVEKFGIREVLWVFAGAGMVLLTALAEQQGFLIEHPGDSGWYLLSVGIFAAAALVLPGISVSYLFLMLGLYDIIIKAIQDIQMQVLMPIGAGLLIGIVLTTRILERAMCRYPGQTYLMILGFVMGAAGTVFPGVPKEAEWITCPVLLAAGYLIIRWITIKEES